MLKLKIKGNNSQYFYSYSSYSSSIDFLLMCVHLLGSGTVKSVGVQHLKPLSFHFLSCVYSLIEVEAAELVR